MIKKSLLIFTAMLLLLTGCEDVGSNKTSNANDEVIQEEASRIEGEAAETVEDEVTVSVENVESVADSEVEPEVIVEKAESELEVDQLDQPNIEEVLESTGVNGVLVDTIMRNNDGNYIMIKSMLDDEGTHNLMEYNPDLKELVLIKQFELGHGPSMFIKIVGRGYLIHGHVGENGHNLQMMDQEGEIQFLSKRYYYFSVIWNSQGIFFRESCIGGEDKVYNFDTKCIVTGALEKAPDALSYNNEERILTWNEDETEKNVSLNGIEGELFINLASENKNDGRWVIPMRTSKLQYPEIYYEVYDFSETVELYDAILVVDFENENCKRIQLADKLFRKGIEFQSNSKIQFIGSETEKIKILSEEAYESFRWSTILLDIDEEVILKKEDLEERLELSSGFRIVDVEFINPANSKEALITVMDARVYVTQLYLFDFDTGEYKKLLMTSPINSLYWINGRDNVFFREENGRIMFLASDGIYEISASYEVKKIFDVSTLGLGDDEHIIVDRTEEEWLFFYSKRPAAGRLVRLMRREF